MGSNMNGVNGHSAADMEAVMVEGKTFSLNGRKMSYRFHVDDASGDLISDHYGGLISESPITSVQHPMSHGGWSKQNPIRREFPDLGRGDFRSPAIRIRHASGHTVSQFQYQSHTITQGKPPIDGLPSTRGTERQAQTLVIHLQDTASSVAVDLSYAVFPQHDAIARSVKVTNNGSDDIVVEKLASFSVDLPYGEYDMLGLRGEWGRECSKLRRRLDYGTQGFGSSAGYSSHTHNPFLALLSPDATESTGDVWGWSLIYSGSFTAEAEKNPHGPVRALIGFNDHQLSWTLRQGEELRSPECVSVFSNDGIGAMSRKFHSVFRQHLIRSPFVDKPRPALLNCWEGVNYDFDQAKIIEMARETAELGLKLFIMDDGWFGVKHPRVNDHAGLGDWEPNPARFPKGLAPAIKEATQFQVAGSQEKLKFGLWVEPEMISPKSELFEQHPDWVLKAPAYPSTECRYQLVLNLALPEVQDYIITSISKILSDSPISYIKWDNNRGMHEVASPSNYHAYILGLYRVLDALTSRFPEVLWEGCASGGGRFDPGILHYFPQSWVSDNTDAVDRLAMQFGTTVVYPASSMGCHISRVPNEVTQRTTSVTFRAHVAMMGGSFGLELDPSKIPEEERQQLPRLLQIAEKVSRTVINGSLWKLSLPEASQHPAAMYVSEDGRQAVLFAFQVIATPAHCLPTLRLQGLDPRAMYLFDGKEKYSGATLMNGGIQFGFSGDYDSRVVFLDKL